MMKSISHDHKKITVVFAVFAQTHTRAQSHTSMSTKIANLRTKALLKLYSTKYVAIN